MQVVKSSNNRYQIPIQNTEGQKIAKKLCSQITKETATLQSLMVEYNACRASETELDLPDVLNPTVIESRLQSKGTWCSLASGEKREIIDSYLLLCRCKEEIAMLQEDIKNAVSYYTQRKSFIKEEIQTRSAIKSLYNFSFN